MESYNKESYKVRDSNQVQKSREERKVIKLVQIKVHRLALVGLYNFQNF